MLQVRKCLRETEGNLGKKKEDLGKKKEELRKHALCVRERIHAGCVRQRIRAGREFRILVIFFLCSLSLAAGNLKAE